MKKHHPDLDVRSTRPGNPGLFEFLFRRGGRKVPEKSQRSFRRLDHSQREKPADLAAAGRFSARTLDVFATANRTPSARSSRPRPCCAWFSTRPCPAYREFHRDLLFHQTDETLFQPFFIGRVCEAVLQQGGPWDEPDGSSRRALHQLNDYLGHRPVAVLRTEQKIQPYDHEWVRPIPLWIRGAGVAHGPYRELVETALAILDATDPALLFDAMFALEQLDELAFDPRAYDFDHPVNKRPNYLFGQWDMNKLDNAGRCRRFVLQQVTLDAHARPRWPTAAGCRASRCSSRRRRCWPARC